MEASTPLIRFFILFLIAYFILRSSLKSLDPTYERKQKAKVKVPRIKIMSGATPSGAYKFR